MTKAMTARTTKTVITSSRKKLRMSLMVEFGRPVFSGVFMPVVPSAKTVLVFIKEQKINKNKPEKKRDLIGGKIDFLGKRNIDDKF